MRLLQSSKLQDTIFKSIEQQVGEQLEQTVEPRDPRHAERARRILDLLFWDDSTIETEEGDPLARKSERKNILKADFERLIDMLPYPWDGKLKHVCPIGCCASRQEACQKVIDCIHKIFSRTPGVPAVNKWLKIYPPISFILVGRLFFGIYNKSLKAALSENGKNNIPRGRPLTLDEILGAGEEDTYQRAETVRRGKSLNFLYGARTTEKLAVAALCSKVVMNIMGLVFRQSKEHNGRALHGDQRPAVFELCDLTMSPVSRTVVHLLDLLADSMHCHWLPLTQGRPWTERQLKSVFHAVFTLCGHLFLTCLVPWSRWPWRLAALVDERASAELKDAVAAEAFRLIRRPCCCDAATEKFVLHAGLNGMPSTSKFSLIFRRRTHV